MVMNGFFDFQQRFNRSSSALSLVTDGKLLEGLVDVEHRGGQEEDNECNVKSKRSIHGAWQVVDLVVVERVRGNG